MATKGKPPLSCSSNSNSASPSSPSSSLQHKSQFMAALSQMQIHGNQQHHQVGSTPNWLGNKFDYDSEPEGGASCRFDDSGAASSNLELMDIEEDRRAESAATAVGVIEKEHMFDKVVTPSDVGKLNRLVIPKQHAEKYFPLDSSTYEKGLLLNFEDRNGKPWRFRYSYWSSSQSYVMTKGWSRFVKDKKLDAGDVVSFQRGVGDLGKDRLYIDWRCRLDARHPAISCQYYQQPFSSIPWTAWSPLLMRPPTSAPLLARDHIHWSNLSPDINAYHSGGSAYGFGSCAYGGSNYSNAVKVNPCSSYASPTFHDMRPAAPSPAPRQQVGMARVIQWQQGGGGHGEPVVYESVPVVQGKAAAKSLRLFGVNMVCPITESNDQCDDILLSSNTIPPHTKQRQQQHPPHGN